ncbi:MAG TPA: tetratricopeptide repeat protein [Actinoplanes sp.]|nr:tetratricopeptide repeat protein [Actinoplanes sp.]
MSQPSPLLAVRQRAQALAGSGDLAGARAVLEQAVDAGKSTLGEDDPDVLTTLHQLARVHQQADDPSSARRVLEEAYAAGQWRLGDSDPLMVEISFDLGVVAEELGNRHEARKAFGRVAGTGASVLGADHWAVARARAYLGDDPAAVRTDGPPQPPSVQPAPVQHAPVQQAPIQHQPIQQAPTQQAPSYHHALTEATVAQPFAAPPPPVQHIVPTQAGVSTPYEKGEPYQRDQKRGSVVFAAIVAGMAAVIAVVALVFVLANRGSDGENVPTLGGPPPTDVRLDDNGSAVRLTWTDPADGKTTFLITGGHPGEVLRPMGQVGPGETSFDLQGLSAQLDYCFAIVAVYSTSKFASSPQTCTSRAPSTLPRQPK